MPQIRQVVSEALQSTVRRLLPSQQGFTEDLMATNVITPIIDLTPTAEGSVLPEDLERALSFQGVTAFSITNTTSTIVNTAGFWRIFGAVSVNRNAALQPEAEFELTDGVTNKRIWGARGEVGTEFFINSFDFIVFLDTGESLTGTSSTSLAHIRGSSRQIADINGNIVNPSGFSPS